MVIGPLCKIILNFDLFSLCKEIFSHDVMRLIGSLLPRKLVHITVYFYMDIRVYIFGINDQNT